MWVFLVKIKFIGGSFTFLSAYIKPVFKNVKSLDRCEAAAFGPISRRPDYLYVTEAIRSRSDVSLLHILTPKFESSVAGEKRLRPPVF